MNQELRKLDQESAPLRAAEHKMREETRNFAPTAYAVQDKYQAEHEAILKRYQDPCRFLKEIDGELSSKTQELNTLRRKLQAIAP